MASLTISSMARQLLVMFLLLSVSVTLAAPVVSSATSSQLATLVTSSLNVTAAITSLAAKQSEDEAMIASQSAEIESLEAKATASPATAPALPTPSTASWSPSDPIFSGTNEESWTGVLERYGNWTLVHRDEIEASELGELGFYIYQTFGNQRGFACGIEEPTCGCTHHSLTTLDFLQKKYPDDKQMARDVLLMLDITDTAFKRYCGMIRSTRDAAHDVALANVEFASIFSPQKDEAMDSKCKAIEAVKTAVWTTGATLVFGAMTDFTATIYIEAAVGGAVKAITKAGINDIAEVEANAGTKAAVKSSRQIVSDAT